MNFKPQDQILWSLGYKPFQPLKNDLKVNIVIVGGGMAGLSAAQAFTKKGLSVALLEQYFCGGGATGKSSGFITPDSELSLSYFVEKFGTTEARKIWGFVTSGVEHIRNTIETYSFSCDYRKQDTLVVASNKAGIADIQKEYESRKKLDYTSTLYSAQEVSTILGSNEYLSGVRYSDTFGINGFLYCQELKKVLVDLGVQIFEESPVMSISDNYAQTAQAKVTADYIIVCADRFLPALGKLTDKVFHVQTYLMTSSPLSDRDIAKIFPREPLMVWDTEMIYNYFRIIQNNRLLVGGASLWYTFHAEQHNNYHVTNKLKKYVRKRLNLSVDFEYTWPGLMGISKDLTPIAGFDKLNKKIYYVSAATGLPWAAALGVYSAQRIIDNNTQLDRYFDPYRKYPLSNFTQKIMGKKLTFALSTYMTTKSF